MMKFKLTIFNLQCWICIESTYKLSEAALFPWDTDPCSWHVTFPELQVIRTFHKTRLYLQNFTSFSQKTRKGADFIWTAWFRNAAASFRIPTVSLRWGLQLLAGLDLPKQSILKIPHIHSCGVACSGKEKLVAYQHSEQLKTQTHDSKSCIQ